ncbi:hypothetical protein SLEP1_g56073 [Rubroshorea leprosula]|uniref:Secreted protein n=1 Tax=Rubroshorea leprosula TaxID=152421 RepID=A0AAV5MLK7_9ROSI|nr:hypothetical protein SLEP1_g56073 [Rubroshorea leprosula]
MHPSLVFLFLFDPVCCFFILLGHTSALVQFPLLSRLNDAYVELPPFQDAMPEKQPDAPPSVVS